MARLLLAGLALAALLGAPAAAQPASIGEPPPDGVVLYLIPGVENDTTSPDFIQTVVSCTALGKEREFRVEFFDAAGVFRGSVTGSVSPQLPSDRVATGGLDGFAWAGGWDLPAFGSGSARVVGVGSKKADLSCEAQIYANYDSETTPFLASLEVFPLKTPKVKAKPFAGELLAAEALARGERLLYLVQNPIGMFPLVTPSVTVPPTPASTGVYCANLGSEPVELRVDAAQTGDSVTQTLPAGELRLFRTHFTLATGFQPPVLTDQQILFFPLRVISTSGKANVLCNATGYVRSDDEQPGAFDIPVTTVRGHKLKRPR